MKNRFLWGFIISLLFIPFVLFGDTITLKDGSSQSGKILGATNTHVHLSMGDSTVVQVPHSQIQSVFFSYADNVSLLTGDKIKCKVIDQVFPDLIVVTSEGIQHIPQTEMRHYFYNIDDSLTVPLLPKTGSLFKNASKVYIKEIKRRMIYGFNMGGQMPSYGSWGDDFIRPGTLVGMVAGIKAKYSLNKTLNIALGLDYHLYSFNSIWDQKSVMNNVFIYANGEIAFKIGKSGLNMHLGVDGGLFYGFGNFVTYSFREINYNKMSFAFRPRIGFSTFFRRNIAVHFDAAFLAAKTGPVEVSEGIDDITINFNGLSLIVGLMYHIPIVDKQEP